MRSYALLYLWCVAAVYFMNYYRLIVRWYDGWIGYYYDEKRHSLYIFLVPWVGIVIDCRRRSLNRRFWQ